MPIIDREKGFRVLIYVIEITRPHVHVLANDRRAIKIWLDPNVEIARNERMNKREEKAALKLVREKRAQYLEEWHALHG